MIGPCYTPLTTPEWSMTHFDVFLEVNSRSEYATKILLVLWCKIIERLIWVLVNSLVAAWLRGMLSEDVRKRIEVRRPLAAVSVVADVSLKTRDCVEPSPQNLVAGCLVRFAPPAAWSKPDQNCNLRHFFRDVYSQRRNLSSESALLVKYRGTSLEENAPPKDPTVGLRLGSEGGPRG